MRQFSTIGVVLPLSAALSAGGQAVSFAQPEVLTPGTTIMALAAADLDGDGLSDLAVFASSSEIRVYHRVPGGFVLVHAEPVEGVPFFPVLDALDVDADGRLDYFAATGDTTPFFTLRQDSGGALTRTDSGVVGGFYAPKFAFGDLNGDHLPDLTTVDPFGVHLNAGGAAFTTIGDVVHANGQITIPLMADVGGDALDDVLVLGGVPGWLSTRINTGGGLLAEPFFEPAPSLPTLALDDFNNDGLADLVVTRSSVPADSFKVRLGQAGGGLADEIDVSTGGVVLETLAASDLNGDGRLDLAGVDIASQTLHVFIGDGDGGFTPDSAFPIPTGGHPSAVRDTREIETGDFDGDGRPDLAIAAGFDGAIILLNTTAFPCAADVNGNGTLEPADFTAWIAAFNAMAPGCDQNGDGLCTPGDFTAWIAGFNARC